MSFGDNMLQRVISKLRKAIEDFNMIEEGDKIAVGLSGGKDSITLLYSLHYLQKFYKHHFELMAITVHPGSETFKTDMLEDMCRKLSIPYVIYKSDIANIVFNLRKESNPCSLCANLRRGILNSVAVENGCNKVALAHHLDDAMETFLMSLFLNGKIYTFSPITDLSRTNIKVIRPLIYVEEKLIKMAAKQNNFPVMGKCCPADGYTKRDYMTELIKTLKKDIPKVRENLYGAIKRSSISGWAIEKNNIKEEKQDK